MKSSSCPRFLFGLLVLLGSSGNLLADEEETRTFPAQKCRFTLPGPDWAWIDKQVPGLLFMAGNTKGFVINLSTVSVPGDTRIDEQFPKGFERSFYQPGQIEKRAGRFVTFRGLPSYQAEGILADGRTSVTRVFMAQGFGYHLTLLGAKEPIEGDPAFETYMQGFDFTTPPEPEPKPAGSGADRAPAGRPAQTQNAPHSDYGKALNISAWMGRIAGGCIVGVVLLLGIRWAIRKSKGI